MIEIGDDMRKKKRKLKKWVKKMLYIILILIILDTIIITFYHQKKTNSKEKNKTEQKENKEKNIQDEITKVCKTIDYCNKKYYKRYENYYKKNKDISMEDVITKVNIGLDYSFYTHTKKTPYLNKTYILVNKFYYVGKDYAPKNLEKIDEDYARSGMKLVSTAKDAFEEMAKNAKEDDKPIIAMSSYRSYDYQVDLYNKYVENDGVAAADTYSARAGFSEHQTGLCVDIYDGVLDYTNFENSESFNWMQENAYKYGFILRFPKGKEDITGYQYESWHYRYVGKEIAKYIKENNITFEEYYAKFIEGKK